MSDVVAVEPSAWRVALEGMSEALASSSDIPALTTRMARGDETAYTEFYDIYFYRLLRYLLVVCGGKEEAAREALQATLLRVVRHIRKFESEEALWSWLTVLARSAAVDEQRKQSRYRVLLDRFFRRQPMAPATSPHDPEAQLLGLLESNLASLDAAERDLLDRKYFERESVHQIAAGLGTTEKAIESRLVRIRRKLKDLILAQLEK